AGSSQSFSFINGQRSASLQFTYVLVPRKEGRYTIEPIRYETDGSIYTSNPVTIDVVKSSSTLPPHAEPTVGSPEDAADSPIFIRAKVDRDTVYVNQQITWTMGFYTDGRVDLLRSPEYSPPNAEGFWVEDLPPQQNFYKLIDGTKYLVNEIKRGLFPTAPGQYRIGAARVEIMLDDFGTRGFDDIFNRRLRTFGFGKPRTLTTDEIAVTVLALPSRGRPVNFSGLVGRSLTVSLKTDKQVVEAGEPVNVTLEIKGEGNFKTMAAPQMPELPGFKLYESGSTSELFKNDYVVSGKKRSEFVLIPQVEGATVIPPVQMSYFDPEAREYKTIQTTAVQMEIKPGTKEKGRQIVFTGSGEDIEVLGRDIHYIHPVPAQTLATGSRLYWGTGYAALHAVPLLAVIVSLVVERRRKRFSGDIRALRRRRAAGEAEKRIGKARDLLRKGQLAEVFATVSGAVRGYFADKMNKSASGVTIEEISAYLREQRISEEDAEPVVSILRICDGAQYSAASMSPDQASRIVKQACDVITSLERR
ncbi:MAG: BatD family protein, partial [Candidatus Krumholzibacteria bacterium]|nr:BatD family protein [Candidatus Krumholzibacteria bacterium]